MDNFVNLKNGARRYKAHVSAFGTTQLFLRNPFAIAWWSAAFPGFGHLLLGKYLRGLSLFIWEITINDLAKINVAMIHTFQGHFLLAKSELNVHFAIMYIPVYIFAIWDSYRTTVDMNHIYLLAEREDAPFNSFMINGAEINYLDRRIPVMSAIWSLFMPGLGQLHIHRIGAGFFGMAASVLFLIRSNLPVAIQWLFLGDIHTATESLDPEWTLFVPSLWAFAAYDSYINTVENNKLFETEQRRFLTHTYSSQGKHIYTDAVKQS